ncbi:MAG TPA: aminotransferase class V-fold PLP-dependent enzyme, partial [Firmicutes bacterium]|nr:aminotransferase class V-fold PLP-dependent enzyme [Bacillota bacterium]
MSKLNVSLLRREFPALDIKVNGHPLAYLDNAATTHSPKVVLDRIRRYQECYNANPHRGAHYLGVKATEMYESARQTVQGLDTEIMCPPMRVGVITLLVAANSIQH